MSKKHFQTSTLLLALAAAALAAPAVAAKPDTRPALLGPTVELSLARADGSSVVIPVDGGGGYRDALYSVEGIGLVQDFSFDSKVLINLGEGESSDITLTGSTRADSSFSLEGLNVRLTQVLSEGPLPGSFLLTQTYQIHNPSPTTATVNLYRYQDSDLHTPVWEAGYIPRNSRYAYLVSDIAPDASRSTHYIGVSAYGGGRLTEQRVAVQQCCESYEVPPELNRTVADDANGDGLSDGLSDRAISRRATLPLAAGASTTVMTQTLMGRTAINSLSELPRR